MLNKISTKIRATLKMFKNRQDFRSYRIPYVYYEGIHSQTHGRGL